MTQNLIQVTTNAKDGKYFFDRLAYSQLPYATSRAINRLAFDIRDQEQGKLDQYFDLRTNWLTKRGAMPVIRSSKSQSPDIHAILGVKDEVAALAITGGEKDGRGAMAVPFSDSGSDVSARSILNPGKETLPKSKWPGSIVKPAPATKTRRKGRNLKPKPFYLKSKSGRTFVALRTGVSPLTLSFLYGFEDKVTVPKSWPLVENTERFIASKYDDYLEQEVARAISSAKL